MIANRKSAFDRAVLALLCVLAAVWMLPLVWVLVLSFKPNDFLMSNTDAVLGGPTTLANYLNIFHTSLVFRWVANSAIVATLQTLGVLVISSLAGYGFARTEFPGRRIVFALVVFGLAIPGQDRKSVV